MASSRHIVVRESPTRSITSLIRRNRVGSHLSSCRGAFVSFMKPMMRPEFGPCLWPFVGRFLGLGRHPRSGLTVSRSITVTNTRRAMILNDVLKVRRTEAVPRGWCQRIVVRYSSIVCRIALSTADPSGYRPPGPLRHFETSAHPIDAPPE